jgi:hypothetical protein
MSEKKGIQFKKSSYSGAYNCVGIARQGENIIVANTKQPENFLEFTLEEWDAFKKGVTVGEFDSLI